MGESDEGDQEPKCVVQKDLYEVTVTNLAGTAHVVKLSPDSHMSELRARTAKLMQVRSDRLQLHLEDGTPLSSSESLLSSGVEDGCELMAVVEPAGSLVEADRHSDHSHKLSSISAENEYIARHVLQDELSIAKLIGKLDACGLDPAALDANEFKRIITQILAAT